VKIRVLPVPIVLAALVALLCASCGASGALLRPNGVAVAPDGTLYVMDRGNYRVAHVTAEGQFLGAFGQFGTGPEDIFAGWDLAVDAAGNLYLCNLTRDEGGLQVHDGIKMFTAAGEFVREIGGTDYTYEESANTPYGLDVDAAGRVYVADFSGDTLRVFDPQGNLQGTFFGATGSAREEFSGLNDVAVDDVRNEVYIVDSINTRVKKYDLAVGPAGEVTLTLRLVFGGYGEGPGEFSYPQYVAVDEASGRLYVNDMGNYRVAVFDNNGHFIQSLEPPGVSSWQGMGLAVGPDGTVYIADALNNVVWAFAADGAFRGRIGGW